MTSVEKPRTPTTRRRREPTPLELARAECLRLVLKAREGQLCVYESPDPHYSRQLRETTGLTQPQLDRAIGLLVDRGEAVVEAVEGGVWVTLVERADADKKTP